MPIIRKQMDTNYTKLWNGAVQEKEMSLKAKGLLWYMLSLPDNWDFTIEGLADSLIESENTIIKTLHELEQFGYHTKKHIYENGRIKDWVYYIYMEPQPEIIEGYKNKSLKTSKMNDSDNIVKNKNVDNQDCCFYSDKQIENNKLFSNNKEKKEMNYIYSPEDEVKKLSNEELKEKEILESIKYIIEYLNATIGSKYKPNSKYTVKLIKARFSEGYNIDDFYDVIDKKYKEWKNTEFEKYLRPETLFSGSHFENYLNQKDTFKGTAKVSYGSKPNFDNIATHNTPKGVASMTKTERDNFINTELAKDANGNFIKF